MASVQDQDSVVAHSGDILSLVSSLTGYLGIKKLGLEESGPRERLQGWGRGFNGEYYLSGVIY
jgi:hypothetical protein